jgi:ubiquinone/menaquinone biosynthesis C-methylase UbiE
MSISASAPAGACRTSLAKGYKYFNFNAKDAQNYDRQVATLVPGYSDMLQTVLTQLVKLRANGKVVDLGGGTGSLGCAILSRLPVEFHLIDFSAAMCDRAMKKLGAGYPRDRFEIQQAEAGLIDQMENVQAVISTLLLHEYGTNLNERVELMRRVLAALAPDGVVIVGDYYRVSPCERTAIADAVRLYANESCGDSRDAEREIAEHLFDEEMPSLQEEFSALSDLGYTATVLTQHLNLITWAVQKGRANGRRCCTSRA